MIPHRPTKDTTTKSLHDSHEVRRRATISIAAVSDLADNLQKQLDGEVEEGVQSSIGKGASVSASSSAPVHSKRGIGFFSSVPTDEERRIERDKSAKLEDARRESLIQTIDARMKLGERKRQDYGAAIQHGKDFVRGGSRGSVISGPGSRRGDFETLSDSAVTKDSIPGFQPHPDVTTSTTTAPPPHSETYTLNELAGFRPPIPQNHWGAAAPPTDRDFFAVVSSSAPSKGVADTPTPAAGPLPLCVNPEDGKSLYQKTAGMKVPEAGAKKTTHDLVRSVHDLLNNVQKLLYHSTITSKQLDDVSARHTSAMALVFETLGPDTARVIRTTSEMLGATGDLSSCASESRMSGGGVGRSSSSHKRQYFNIDASSNPLKSPRMDKSIESLAGIEDGCISVASLSRGASASKLTSSRSPLLTARSPTNLASQMVNRMVKTASMSNLSLGVQQQLQDEVEIIDSKYRAVLMDVAKELSVANNNRGDDNQQAYDVSILGGDNDAPSPSSTNWITTSREAANSQRASARDVLHDVTAIRTLMQRLEGEIDVKADPIVKENKSLRMQLLKAHMDIRIMRNQLHKYKVTSKFRQLGAERKKRQELLIYINECKTAGEKPSQTPLSSNNLSAKIPTSSVAAAPQTTVIDTPSSLGSQITLKRRVTVVTVTAADVLLLQESLPPNEARQAIDVFRLAIGAVIADLPCAVLRSDFFAPSLLSGGASSGGDPLALDDGGPMYNLRHLDRPGQDDDKDFNNTPSTSVVSTISTTHAQSSGKSFHANGFSGNGASVMLAFPDPIDALAFTERLHLLLIACPWSYQLINWHSPRGHVFPYGALREQDVDKVDPIIATTASTTSTTGNHLSTDNGASAAVNSMHFSSNTGCSPFRNSLSTTNINHANKSSPHRKSMASSSHSGFHGEDSSASMSPSASPQRARNFEINRFRGFMQDEPSAALSHYFNAFMEQHREENGGRTGSIVGGMSPMTSRASSMIDSLPHSHEIHTALTRIMMLVDTHPVSANNAVAASQQQRCQGSSPADIISEAAAMVLKSVFPAASNLHYGLNPDNQHQGSAYIRADTTTKSAANVVFRGLRAQIGIDVGDIAIEHLGHSYRGGSLLGGTEASFINRDTLRIAEAYFRGEITDKELLEAREARRKAENEQNNTISPGSRRYHYPNYAGPITLKAAIYGQTASKSSLLASVARPGETLLSETSREALSEQLVWQRNQTPQSGAPGKSGGAHRVADAFVSSGATNAVTTSPSAAHPHRGSKRGGSIASHHSVGQASSFFVAPLSIGALVRGGATGRPSQLRHGHHSLPASQSMATHPLGSRGCQYLDTLFSSTSADGGSGEDGSGGTGAINGRSGGGKERRGGDIAVSLSSHEEIVYTVLPALLVKRALHFTREVDDGIASRRYIGALNPLWYLPFPAYPTTGGHLAHLWSSVLAAVGEESFGGQRNIIGVVDSLSTPMSLSEQLRQAQLSAAGLLQIANDALNAYEYQHTAHKKVEARLRRVEEECMTSHDQSPIQALLSLCRTKLHTLVLSVNNVDSRSPRNGHRDYNASNNKWKMFSDTLQEAVVVGHAGGSYIRSVLEGPLGLYICPLLDILLGSHDNNNSFSALRSSTLAREGSSVRFEDITNYDSNKNPLLQLPVYHRENKVLLVLLALLQTISDVSGELSERCYLAAVMEDEVVRAVLNKLTLSAPSPFSDAGSPRNTTAAAVAGHFSPASTYTQALHHPTTITCTSPTSVSEATSIFTSMMIESMVAESIVGSTWDSLRSMYCNPDDDDRVGLWGEVTVAMVCPIRRALKESQHLLSSYTRSDFIRSSTSLLATQAILEFLSRNLDVYMDNSTNTVSVSSLGLISSVASWNAFVFERYPNHVAQLCVSSRNPHKPALGTSHNQTAQSTAKMHSLMSEGSRKLCQPGRMSILSILRHILDHDLLRFAKGEEKDHVANGAVAITDVVGGGNGKNSLDVVDAYFKDGATAFRPLFSSNRPIEAVVGVLPNGRVNTTITTNQHESLKQTISTVTMTWSLWDLLTFAFTSDVLSRLFAKLVNTPADDAIAPKSGGSVGNPSTLTTGSKLAASTVGAEATTDVNLSFKGSLAAQKAATTLLANTRSKLVLETATFTPSTVAESKETLVKGLTKALASLGHAVADQPDCRNLMRILDDRLVPTLRVTNLLDSNTVQQEAILSRYAEQFVLTARDPSNRNYSWFLTLLQSCAVTVSITYAIHALATLPPILNEVVALSHAPQHHVMELHGPDVHHNSPHSGGDSISSITDSLTSPLSPDTEHQQHHVHQVPLTCSQLQHVVRLKSQYRVEGLNFLSLQRWAMQSMHVLSETHAHNISMGYISTDTIVVDASVEPGTHVGTNSPRSKTLSKTPIGPSTTLPTVGVHDAAASFLQAPASIGLHLLESTTEQRDIQKLVDNTAPELLMCLDRSASEGAYNQWLAVVRHHLTGKVLGATSTSSTGAVPASISKILTAMMDCVMEGEGRAPTNATTNTASVASPVRKSSHRGGAPTIGGNDTAKQQSFCQPSEQDFLASGLDSALDVWMLGCALFEVTCGVHPLSIIRTLEPSKSITGIKTTPTTSTSNPDGEGLTCVTECLNYYSMHIKTTYTQEDLRTAMDSSHHGIHRPSVDTFRLSMSFGGGALSGLGGGGAGGLAATMRSTPVGRNRSSTIAAPNRQPSSGLGMSFNGGDFERQQAAMSLAGGDSPANASHNLAASTRVRRLSVAAVATTASRRPFGSIADGSGGVNNDSFTASPMENATVTRRRGYSNASLLGSPSGSNNPRSPLHYDDSTNLLPLLLCARNTSILGRDAGTALRLLKLGMCTQKGWGTSPFSRECGYKIEKNLEEAIDDHERLNDVSAAFSIGSSEYAKEVAEASSAATLHTLEESSLVLLADLLHKMLRANPFERISAAEALQHPYFFLQPIQAVNKGTSSSVGNVQAGSAASNNRQRGDGSPVEMGSPAASFRGMGSMRDKPDLTLPSITTLVPPSQRTSLWFPSCHYLHTPPPLQHRHASPPPHQPSWSEEISHITLQAILGKGGKRNKRGGGVGSGSEGCPTVVLSMPSNSSLPHILPLPAPLFSLDDSSNTLRHHNNTTSSTHQSRFAINDDLSKIPSMNAGSGDGGVQLLDITRHPNFALQREYLEAIVMESVKSADSFKKNEMDANLRKFISGVKTTHGAGVAQGVLQGGKASLLDEVSKALRLALSRTNK